MIEIFYLLLLGSFTGILAGLLGIGGGIILVPTLLWVFQNQPQINQNHLMQIVLATSLTTIIFTAISSIRAHQKRKAIQWSLVKKLAPGMVLGTLLGAFVASSLSNSILKIIFGVFLLLISLQLLIQAEPKAMKEFPGKIGSGLSGFLIGNMSALVGIGGGSLVVPLLLWFRIPVRNAIATSAACGLPIALAGALGYVLVGIKNGLGFTAGYIYWPAVFSIVPTSLLFVPLGAKLAHSMPVGVLKKIFAVFLLLISSKMLISNLL
ncbi:MAG: sulfite exporter TauE/SafE family protein [Silvanigrellaceae bacterium]|nr:sulfite exporter TauE/SafE family protein [Silvanigrellaceae bacterium]